MCFQKCKGKKYIINGHHANFSADLHGTRLRLTCSVLLCPKVAIGNKALQTNNDGDAFRHASLTANSYRSILERIVHRMQIPSNYMQRSLIEGFTAERSRSLCVNTAFGTPTILIFGVTFRSAQQDGFLCFFLSLPCGLSAVPPASVGTRPPLSGVDETFGSINGRWNAAGFPPTLSRPSVLPYGAASLARAVGSKDKSMAANDVER